MYKQQPVMSHPVNPSDPDFQFKFNQYLCDILDNTGLIHQHNKTCFKHLPKNVQALWDDNKDCRFQLPRPTNQTTCFDEDGYVVLGCNDGFVHGHSPLIIFTLDTALVFSALCAAIKAFSENPPMDIDSNLDAHEYSRQLLIKTVNKLIGNDNMNDESIPLQEELNPDEDDTLIYLQLYFKSLPTECWSKSCNLLFNDIFLRPDELKDISAWDQMWIHPQYLTYCLKKITSDELPHVPVLTGHSIPRNDQKDQQEKHALAMLALLKPWSNNESELLKLKDISLIQAFNDWKSSKSIKKSSIRVMENMQLLPQSKDANFDYAAMRQK
ncbi:hypothetical protein GYMLUDRAFT_62327 [Collybiopsis luxurians FD-317 M1]|uniref:Uncharacterized protein n=1 Tax=Collybiopsis luxurians FD-317 M1 TaxID=944289 RepID=A0A0D0C0P7_9AGAR|nr:hypothetical protein GYMLUDRAFT_62327 [Collybiopsis luxurians FD-317 M1]